MEGHVSGQSNKPLSKLAHALEREAIVKELDANPSNGLTAAEAQSRLTEYGKNELENGPGVQPLKILLRQVANAMMLVSLTSRHSPSEWLTCTGLDHGHGRVSSYQILDRGRCRGRRYRPKHRRRFHARIEGREDDEWSPRPELTYRQRSP